VIVDDYGNVAGCRQAVHDFRARRMINDPIRPIDWVGACWRRSGDGGGYGPMAVQKCQMTNDQ
jgi:Macrocin-O-methyltransferase (TylF)